MREEECFVTKLNPISCGGPHGEWWSWEPSYSGIWEVSYQKIKENFDLAPTLAADLNYHWLFRSRIWGERKCSSHSVLVCVTHLNLTLKHFAHEARESICVDNGLNDMPLSQYDEKSNTILGTKTNHEFFYT